MPTGNLQDDKSNGPALAAVLHEGDQSGDKLISTVARNLQAQGIKVGGVIQSNPLQPGQCRCDMILEELTTGEAVPISQNLGNQSRGCRLDPAALEHVVGLVEASLEGGVDVLVLNKFGKSEAEGNGLRDAIAMAVASDIPVLVGLNKANMQAWTEFCGGEGQFLKADEKELENWLNARGSRISQNPPQGHEVETASA